MKIIQHYVGGKTFSGGSKKTSKVFNPATGEHTANVKLANIDDLNKSVENAKRATSFIFL